MGQERYSSDVVSFAKMLFMLVDAKTGNRLYNAPGVISRIKETFGESPTPQIVNLWFREWDKELGAERNVAIDEEKDLSCFCKESKRLLTKEKLKNVLLEHLRMSIVHNSARMRSYSSLESKLLDTFKSQLRQENKDTDNKDSNKLHRAKLLLKDVKFSDIQRGVLDSNKSFLDQISKLYSVLENDDNDSKTVVDAKVDEDWEFEPVDIDTFLYDDEFLGSISNTFFGCVTDDIIRIFGGNPRLFFKKRRFREVIFKEAFGTGKSYRAAIATSYIVYLLMCLRNPQRYLGQSKSAKLTITNVSVNGKQAKDVIFSKVKSMIDTCKWFRDHGYNYDPNSKLELRFDPADSAKMDYSKIYKNVYVIPGSSSEFSAVGYDVILGIIDEATAYPHQNGEDMAELIYEAFKARIKSRFPNSGMIIMAGNPHHVEDFLEKKIIESEGMKDVYIVKERAIWEAKMPDYNGDYFYFDKKKLTIVDDVEKDKLTVMRIPMPYYDDFKEAPETSARNLAGLSLESISRFITNVDKVDEVFLSGRKNPVKEINGSEVVFHDWFKPVNKGMHAIHVDIGVNNDACAIALGHISDYSLNNPHFWFDCIIRLQGSQSTPTILEDVRNIIYALSNRGFYIKYVSYDGYQSTDSIQILTKKGYEAGYASVDKRMTPYINLRQAIYENRVDCHVHKLLRHELCNLENVNDKKVDHPFRGSKDCSDAMAGVVSLLIEKVPIEGVVSNIGESHSSIPNGAEIGARTAEEIYNESLNDIGEGGSNGTR